jgi:hypothetical protein
MNEHWLQLVAGVVFVVVGALIAWFRNAISNTVSAAQRAFQGRLGDGVAKHQTPRWTAVFGCGVMVSGLVFIGNAASHLL